MEVKVPGDRQPAKSCKRPRSDIFRQHFVFMTYDILHNDEDIKEGNANYIIPQNKPDNSSSRPQYIKLGMGIRYSLPAYTEDVQMSKHVVSKHTYFIMSRIILSVTTFVMKHTENDDTAQR